MHPAFYIVVAPCAHCHRPNTVLDGVIPHMMPGWYPYPALICAQEQNTCEVDLTYAASVSGKVWQMSQDKAYCHDVQKLLTDSDDTVKIEIAQELHSHVWDAVHHPYANFVVQKCVETLRPDSCQFIVDELISSDRVPCIAQHKYGCRIIQRLLEYCRADQVDDLVQTLLGEALVLTRNSYGIYVIQHILEYACMEHQRYLVDLLIENVSDICSTNISCAVVDAVFNNGHDEDCVALAHATLKHEVIANMARSRHGHIAVKTILKLIEGRPEYRIAQKQLLASKDSLNKTRYGRSIMKIVDEKNVSDVCPESGLSERLRHEATHQMSWADLTLDTEEEDL